MSDKKYTLTVDAKQLGVIMHALDLYNRVGIGQFDTIVRGDNLLFNLPTDEWLDRVDQTRFLLEEAKTELLGLAGGYFSIYNPKVTQEVKMAWELIQVFRRHLAFERQPEGGWEIEFDDFKKCSDHPYKAEIATVTK